MNTKLNNKGMSLIELVIAIAIASVVSFLIVTMMVSSTTMFRQESSKIDVQNDLQVLQNQITDALREAKEINIVKCGDSIRIYTGAVNTTTNQLVAEPVAGGSVEKYTDVIITYKDNVLYITSAYMEDIPKGYILSENVSDFDISISGSPIGYTEDVTDSLGVVSGTIYKEYYDNPITVNVSLKIGTGDKMKNADMTVQVRNKIKTFNVYSPTSFDQYLSGVTPTVYELR